jgi:hypothetical protein
MKIDRKKQEDYYQTFLDSNDTRKVKGSVKISSQVLAPLTSQYALS